MESPRRPSYANSKQVDDSQIPQATHFLQDNGFSKVEYTKQGPTDFKALHKGRPAYVELRVVSPKASRQNHFLIRLSKLRILEKFSLQGEVYVLLINKEGFRLVPFHEIPNHPEISIFTERKYVDTRYWSFLTFSGGAVERSLRDLCKATGLERNQILDALINFGSGNLNQFQNYLKTAKELPKSARDFADISAIRVKHDPVSA